MLLPVTWFCISHQFFGDRLSNILFIQSQLKICKGISYAAVAAHADKSGRRKLAAMLVEHEPRSSKQVSFFFNLFLSMSFSELIWLFLPYMYIKSKAAIIYWLDVIRPERRTCLILLGNFCTSINILIFSDSSLAKHWGRRFCSREVYGKWWHGSCLSCSVPYLE